jgi:hypothetical protein
MTAIDLDLREQKVKELAKKVAEIQTQINDAETIADNYGITIYLDLGGRSNWYNPRRPDGVTDDDVDGTDWQESEDEYDEYSGWQNSSSNC